MLTLPVIGRFNLLAIIERLAEQAILIVQSVAGGGLPHRCHRIHVAGGQPPQPAVAQRRIDLLLQQLR